MSAPVVNHLDVESLHRALQQSFSPDDSLRRPAEELIKELKFIHGSCLMLIRVATESQVGECECNLNRYWNGLVSLLVCLRFS